MSGGAFIDSDSFGILNDSRERDRERETERETETEITKIGVSELS